MTRTNARAQRLTVAADRRPLLCAAALYNLSWGLTAVVAPQRLAQALGFDATGDGHGLARGGRGCHGIRAGVPLGCGQSAQGAADPCHRTVRKGPGGVGLAGWRCDQAIRPAHGPSPASE